MIITIDTGGTKTLVSSFDKRGQMGDSFRFPTPKDTKQYISQLKEVLRDNYIGQDIDAVVIALPGMIDTKKGIALNCYNLGWKNFNIVTPLRSLLPGVPVLLENDANLAGLAETRALSPVPVSSLYVTISTGIGAGLCYEGKIAPAMRYCEAGHSVIEYDGKLARWESFASGSAIVRTYKKFARDIKSKRIWYQIADRISRGFLSLIPTIQPNVIVIGGSVGTHFDKYGEMLSQIIDERLPSHIPRPKIIQAQHPEEAVIYGCYYYAKDYLSSQKNS